MANKKVSPKVKKLLRENGITAARGLEGKSTKTIQKMISSMKKI